MHSKWAGGINSRMIHFFYRIVLWGCASNKKLRQASCVYTIVALHIPILKYSLPNNLIVFLKLIRDHYRLRAKGSLATMDGQLEVFLKANEARCARMWQFRTYGIY